MPAQSRYLFLSGCSVYVCCVSGHFCVIYCRVLSGAARTSRREVLRSSSFVVVVVVVVLVVAVMVV